MADIEFRELTFIDYDYYSVTIDGIYTNAKIEWSEWKKLSNECKPNSLAHSVEFREVEAEEPQEYEWWDVDKGKWKHLDLDWLTDDADRFAISLATPRMVFRRKPKKPEFEPGWYLLINSPTIRWISWECKERYNLDHWEQITELPESP